MARLFIALWPDDPVREAMRPWRMLVLDQGLARGTARPAPIERLHLTLHFIGNVAQDRVPALIDGLGVPFRPFELLIQRVERWRGGLVVAPVDDVPAELQALQDRLGQALRLLGLTVESRPFRPHLTLARRHTGPLPDVALPPLHWPVRGYALVESMHAAGEGYRVLKSWPDRAVTSPAQPAH